MTQQVPIKEHLERSLEFIRTQEAQMRRALQSPQGRLLLAIKHASQMLGELRTSALPPRPYYELYNACFDALTLLQGYMREAHRTHHLTDVYEIVEYTGNVLPRLYLMITVGTAYLGTGDAPNQEVMKDMLEMCRALQQPLRGMFLRYYLGQRTRDFLATASRADLHFSIHFTLTNFVEMNKLWVRYQHQGHSREFEKRREERRQLQTVIGSSIYRLAQLDSVDLLAFKELVLPSVLEQVVQCRDPLAQEYLLDVVTQAFPAEYHLDTLDQYFDCVMALVPQTSKRSVLVASLNRVYDYAKAAKDEHEERSKSAQSLNVTKTPDSRDPEHVSSERIHSPTETQAEDAFGSNESPLSGGSNPSADLADGAHGAEASDTHESQLPAGDEAAAPAVNYNTAESTSQGRNETSQPGTPDSATRAQDTASAPVTGDVVADAESTVNSGAAESDNSTVASPENAKADRQAEKTTRNEATEGDDVVVETPQEISEVDHVQSREGGEPQSSESKQTNQGTDFDEAGPPSAGVSGLNVTEASERHGQARNPFSDALTMYWHTVQQLELTSADRAVLVRKLVELAELAEVEEVSLSALLKYVVRADLKPSIEFEELVLALLDSRHDLSDILDLLKQLPQMLASQSKETRHAVATKVLDNMVSRGAAISDIEQAKQVFSLFGMLLKSGDLDATKITQLLHLLQSQDSSTTLELLQLAYGTLREGGPLVVKKTFGVLVNTTLLLLRDGTAAPALVGRALKFVNKVCHDLTTFGESSLSSYRLYLLAVCAADYVGAEEAAYELFAEALTTYEEHISDSRQQVAALAIAIRTLQRTTVFSEENFEPLAQRCQQSCQRLLKKHDQCRMLLLVATLYWGNYDAHLPKVSETLARALRVADSIMDTKTSLDLFLDLLESYLFFLGAESDRQSVKVDEVNSLLALIKQNFDAAKTDDNDSALVKLQARMDRIHRYVESAENEIEEYQELVF